MIQALKKTIFCHGITNSWSQKLSEMPQYNFYVMELREKWVSLYDVN